MEEQKELVARLDDGTGAPWTAWETPPFTVDEAARVYGRYQEVDEGGGPGACRTSWENLDSRAREELLRVPLLKRPGR